jgi:ABC-2 type transport system permease protein
VTLAAERWPSYAEPAEGARSRPGTWTVWRLELGKLSHLMRVKVIVAGCVIGPFVVVAGLRLTGATPGDTPFGIWTQTSGFAIPMLLLGSLAPYVLPALTAVVAGDMFSGEDHFGTWKTILTRSCSRGQLFAGKFLAAVTFAVVLMVLLTVFDLAAALLAGTQPVVGLGGQLVPSGQATQLVLTSYISELPPLLGFTVLAIFLSVVSRSTIAGIGGLVVIAVLMEILSFTNLPTSGQNALLSTPFGAWHGFWADPAFYGPFWEGLLTSAGWFVVFGALSWLVFRRRTIGVAA